MFAPFSLNLKGCLHVYNRPQVMGIVNVTPDSFYSGSRTMDETEIGLRIESMIEDGVDFIDIGAYSSRPGAGDISPQEEMNRLRKGMAVLRGIAPEIPVSVDTFRADVAKAAIEEMGADIINDISGGALDSNMFDMVARLKTPYILMHMRGTPATMQQFTAYADVVADVVSDLSVKLRQLRLAGVADVIVDPGFGFSKNLEQNFKLMNDLSAFSVLDCPVLVGISRKSMITKSLNIEPSDALAPTVALDAIALTKGASFIRVHDVREAAQTVTLFSLLNS
ncbi:MULTISPECIES: dihydropteroate synthase [Duncaniella]|jgi:dihydropteroate synthase|uniref:dihydropteroate synthase n=2 Tax=Duncaniella muris TaxID=2094150 RepID=A0A2V1ILF6_9BACT|nr:MULTISPECIES: dihydropteroate synthase [Duncaniella]ROS90991.1 dihydropteroate synthase [Muribaculaceae bacterium Isolate-039 (Harlan)]ROS97796.1 dihydropteroate synthase [Muribaculaceae bacterium Isolate-077 (Janvier)]ROS99284.1 dihydropteroate synthase [Muribaculaceae bacterium Isolate-083 (Janvier)]ROT02130.1 dihydropteroate synthase [Muribaculaceae bacterium Isolate-084 (Janvier)]GFI51967.1 dihydropteroate synthase [Muribaculaceae bacterium]